MFDTLTRLGATYGYLVVGLLILLESAGIPLPGETALLMPAAAVVWSLRSVVQPMLTRLIGLARSLRLA